MPYVKTVDMRILVARHGKRCPVCKIKKKSNEFNNHKSRHDGKQAYCRDCQKAYFKSNNYSQGREAYKREWTKKNPGKSKLYSKRYRDKKKQQKQKEYNEKIKETINKIKSSYSQPNLIGSTANFG